MSIYMHDHVLQIRRIHQNLLSEVSKYSTVVSYLIMYAKSMELAFRSKEVAASVEISNYYKPLIGKNEKEIFLANLPSDDFLDISASVHGFDSFHKVSSAQLINQDFEKAIELLLTGEIEKLERLLISNPSLAVCHSHFGHKAQLIHYCASNAVEMYRQVVPDNLLEIIQILLKYGADPAVKIPVYGGHFDFFELFSSSAHPKESGVDKVIYQYFTER